MFYRFTWTAIIQYTYPPLIYITLGSYMIYRQMSPFSFSFLILLILFLESQVISTYKDVTDSLCHSSLALSAIFPLIVDRFGSSLRFCYQEFDEKFLMVSWHIPLSSGGVGGLLTLFFLLRYDVLHFSYQFFFFRFSSW